MNDELEKIDVARGAVDRIEREHEVGAFSPDFDLRGAVSNLLHALWMLAFDRTSSLQTYTTKARRRRSAIEAITRAEKRLATARRALEFDADDFERFAKAGEDA